MSVAMPPTNRIFKYILSPLSDYLKRDIILYLLTLSELIKKTIQQKLMWMKQENIKNLRG